MNKNIFKNLIKSQRGGTMLMLTILILSSIITVSLVSADIVLNSLKGSRIQNYSTIAFFAAEAGAERILEELRRNNVDVTTCAGANTSGKFCFTNQDILTSAVAGCIAPDPATCAGSFDNQFLGNSAEYKVNYKFNGQWTELTSYGIYGDTQRVVEVSFCDADCAGQNCGVDDGCGDPCPPFCSTAVGCKLAPPAGTVEVMPGACCGGACYDCDVGFAWNGTACVNSTFCGDGVAQSPNSNGVNELCDTTSPMGGNQECASDCLAIGYGFYMENNTTIDMDNVYFTAVNSDERYVDVTCKAGRVIDIYGICESGTMICVAGAEGTGSCRIGCTAYNIPGNQSYYQFTCR